MDITHISENFGINEIRKAVNIDYVDDDAIFEERTREALIRVENNNVKGMSKDEFLKELDSW